MAALTAVRMTRERRVKNIALPLLNGFKSFAGGIACLDPNAATVKQGLSANPQLVPIGEFVDTVDNTSGSAAVNVVISLDDELVLRNYDNDGGTPVTSANLYQICYLLDDHTATMNPTNNAVLGRVWGVDSINGVAVEKLAAGAVLKLSPLPMPALPAFAANAITLAASLIQQDCIFDVPTTSGASTITLPATALDGTRITFCADGTKNGHTVTYVDATGPTNLTTALTASKRHLVVCVKEGGKWMANAYVGP